MHRTLDIIIGIIGIIVALGFILAGVMQSQNLARVSLLAPGFCALTEDADTYWPLLLGVAAAHFGVVVLLFINWRRQWERLLARAA